MQYKRPHIIIASNRGAITFEPGDDGLIAKRGAGGLVTAITTAIDDYNSIWVSAAMSDGDRQMAKRMPYNTPNAKNLNFRFILPNKDEYHKYYNIISNQLLWFCYHYLWKLSQDPVFDKTHIDAWKSYMALNKLFAEAIIEEAAQIKESKLIFLQDYHLLLAGKYIRERDPIIPIAHFSHTAWPQPDYLSVLPRTIVNSIFEGMLSNDLLGFQSERYKNNFLSCCQNLTGHEVNLKQGEINTGKRRVKTAVYPISVDSKAIIDKAASKPVLEYQKKFEKQFFGQKVVLRIERIDPTKNTLRGLEAFERMLLKYPQTKGTVVYVCLLYSSRSDIPEYAEYSKKVQVKVDKINKDFGNTKWKPIFLDIQDNYERSLASLKIYDVLVVNSVYDGMNLIAKEGPLVNEKNGVLVLSENTGAFDEVGRFALRVNPFDTEEIADRMYEALTIEPIVRKSLQVNLSKSIKENTAKNWLQKQVNDLSMFTNQTSLWSNSIASSTLSNK